MLVRPFSIIPPRGSRTERTGRGPIPISLDGGFRFRRRAVEGRYPELRPGDSEGQLAPGGLERVVEQGLIVGHKGRMDTETDEGRISSVRNSGRTVVEPRRNQAPRRFRVRRGEAFDVGIDV